MNMATQDHKRLLELAELHCVGELDEQQLGELEQLLDGDTNACAIFGNYVQLHANLEERLLAEANMQAAYNPSSMPDLRHGISSMVHFFTKPTPLSMSVAALVVGLLITLMAFMAPPFYRVITRGGSEPHNATERQFVVRLTGIHEAKWGDGQDNVRQGREFLPGQQLSLQQGIAELTFSGGARVVLQAPAIFEALDANSGRLSSGSLTAYTPQKAKGFSIFTPSTRVVDLGTEFGVHVFDENVSDIVVLSGEVECFRRDADGNEFESVRLTQGQGASVAADAGSIVKREKVEQSVLAAHRGRADRIVAERNALAINFDTTNNPLRASLPSGYHTYAASDGGGISRRYRSPLGADGSVEVRVSSPFFRNSYSSGYGAVTALHPTKNPTIGHNAVVNSGALVNDLDGRIGVAIKGLSAGEYRIKFFLHNTFIRPGASVKQGHWSISGPVHSVDVPATYGFNEPVDRIQGIPPTGLASVGQVELTLSVATDGANVECTFTPGELAGNEQLWVNGFELTSADSHDTQQTIR